MKNLLISAALLLTAGFGWAGMTPSPAPPKAERLEMLLVSEPAGRLSKRLELKAYSDGFTLRCAGEAQTIACLWANQPGRLTVRFDWEAVYREDKPVVSVDTIGGRWEISAAKTAKAGNVTGTRRPVTARPLFLGYRIEMTPDGEAAAAPLRDDKAVAEFLQERAHQTAERQAAKALRIMLEQP